MQHDTPLKEDEPMTMEFIDAAFADRGVVVVTIRKGTPEQRKYAVIDPPANVPSRKLQDDVDDAGYIDLHEDQYRVSTPHGDLRLEEVLQSALPAEDAEWRSGVVLEVGHLEIAVSEGDAGRISRKIVGNDRDTVSWHDGRLHETVSVGDVVHYKLTEDGRMAAIRHPDPCIAEFGMDCLAYRGVTADDVTRIVTPWITLFHRDEINIESTADGWTSTRRSTLDDTSIIEFQSVDGLLYPAFDTDIGQTSFGSEGVSLYGRSFPDTVSAAAVGERLSRLVELPFPHGDPTISKFECHENSGGLTSATIIDVESPLRHLLRDQESHDPERGWA